jgi:hypothetical protein
VAVQFGDRGTEDCTRRAKIGKLQEYGRAKAALEVDKLAKEKEEANRAIMFMNPNSMNAAARAYWEITHAKILAELMASRGSDGGAHGGV